MDSQVFFSDIRCNFNLRHPNRDKSSIIYLVTTINGRQYKVSTNVKVKPRHWDDKRDMAYIGFRLSAIDNSNNLTVNKRIDEVRRQFQEFKAFICNNPSMIHDAPRILRRYVVSSDKNHISAIRLLNEAFDRMYPNEDGTRRTNRSRLDSFISYVKENKLSDDVSVVLSQPILDKYKSHLVNSNNFGVGNINDKCEVVARLINNKLAVDDIYRPYGIKKVEYVKVKDRRKREDSKKTSLTDEEVERLKEVKLSPMLSEYRDLFLMLLYCGMRISDVEKVIDAPVSLDDDSEEECIILTTKERVEAVITFTRPMKELIRKYKEGFEYINFTHLTTSLNQHIKDIARMAKLDRVIEWREQYGESRIVTKSAPLHKIISAHFARHTWITQRILEGWQADKLCYASGHTDDTMIKQIYTHLTKENKINIVRKEKNRLKGW
ncbi:MAG: tyrosine-type recombinase/integrase [Bacteroides sp.]|nr:tyrosine-type recombinase/integrase [Bacteroides sp.]